ncbi:MAG: tetratricopeptide repeat protein, partial [Candidatus Solibacter usitatus]|nr:tetratricopeptide repeat protein [Candidatus Solibacter usitatus]
GPQGTRNYEVAHVLGGKNVYYLLTPLARGRLQVLPVAFDVRTKKWYDMAATGVRPHADRPTQSPLPWTDAAFTFNTSCYGCHVSQVQTNYDAAADSYRTTWTEPGINCATCHGDGAEHAALMKSGRSEKDPRIARMGSMSTQQRNEMCAPCHAKMSALSSGYQPLQRFFDHYDLVTLESPDFYPDGRDLGENYTYTSWQMSSCVRRAKFECLHCHTSSGAFRFAGENADRACLPCHANVTAAHTHHKPESAGARCIGCHMPKTRFAAMERSDHSMQPPTPAATARFGSPNACNVCHADRDAAWADLQARQWYGAGYQTKALERAGLIDAARKRQWSRAPAMLAYLARRDLANPVMAASLIRLLRALDDARKWPVLLEKLQDPSPLVRAAAASGLADGVHFANVREALRKAVRDEYRLVRIRAAASLAGVPSEAIPQNAIAELEASYNARPDDFAAQTNLGNFLLRRGNVAGSVHAFERAIRLRPDSVGTLVNASVAYSSAGKTADAERVLRQAQQHAPQNAAVHFNLALLLAETNRAPEAEAALRAALEADPKLAPALYNLAILVARTDRKQAIELCRRAIAISPERRYVELLDRLQR